MAGGKGGEGISGSVWRAEGRERGEVKEMAILGLAD